jgi:taurine--2-oxoglutarate transaminase
MGMRDAIAEHFEKNVFWTGLTYSCHAMALAAGVAAVQVLIEEGIVENAARMEKVMREHMASLAKKHPSIGAYRATGLFGALEFRKNAAGEPLAAYNVNHPGIGKLVKTLLDNGLFTLAHWNTLFCNPPLCITAEQLGEAFAIIDDALSITDEHFEG